MQFSGARGLWRLKVPRVPGLTWSVPHPPARGETIYYLHHVRQQPTKTKHQQSITNQRPAETKHPTNAHKPKCNHHPPPNGWRKDSRLDACRCRCPSTCPPPMPPLTSLFLPPPELRPPFPLTLLRQGPSTPPSSPRTWTKPRSSRRTSTTGPTCGDGPLLPNGVGWIRDDGMWHRSWRR